MIVITNDISLPEEEIQLTAVRAQGPGGQNVNKVSSAIHLRFDITASSLPEPYKERLLNLNDRRITKDGVLIIKAQQSRSQEQNREEALERLAQLIRSITTLPTRRRPTRPSRKAKMKRLEQKTRRSRIKKLRGPVAPE